MVTIDTHKIGDSLDVQVQVRLQVQVETQTQVDDTKFDLGLLNKDARIELARNLSQAATDILDSI